MSYKNFGNNFRTAKYAFALACFSAVLSLPVGSLLADDDFPDEKITPDVELRTAIETGNEARVRELLDQHSPQKLKLNYSFQLRSVMHAAARSQKPEIIRLLLEHGANPNNSAYFINNIQRGYGSTGERLVGFRFRSADGQKQQLRLWKGRTFSSHWDESGNSRAQSSKYALMLNQRNPIEVISDQPIAKLLESIKRGEPFTVCRSGTQETCKMETALDALDDLLADWNSTLCRETNGAEGALQPGEKLGGSCTLHFPQITIDDYLKHGYKQTAIPNENDYNSWRVEDDKKPLTDEDKAQVQANFKNHGDRSKGTTRFGFPLTVSVNYDRAGVLRDAIAKFEEVRRVLIEAGAKRASEMGNTLEFVSDAQTAKVRFTGTGFELVPEAESGTQGQGSGR